jgi:hypothetical protein
MLLLSRTLSDWNGSTQLSSSRFIHPLPKLYRKLTRKEAVLAHDKDLIWRYYLSDMIRYCQQLVQSHIDIFATIMNNPLRQMSHSPMNSIDFGIQSEELELFLYQLNQWMQIKEFRPVRTQSCCQGHTSTYCHQSLAISCSGSDVKCLGTTQQS